VELHAHLQDGRLRGSILVLNQFRCYPVFAQDMVGTNNVTTAFAVTSSPVSVSASWCWAWAGDLRHHLGGSCLLVCDAKI